METVLLYFFSTSAQILGALLAIVGLFYSMRVDKLKNRVQKKIEIIRHQLNDDEIRFLSNNADPPLGIIRFDVKYLIENTLLENQERFFQGMAELESAFLQNPADSDIIEFKRNELLSSFEYIKISHLKMNNLSSLFKGLLLFNGVVIGLHVIAFAFIHFISNGLGLGLLIIGVITTILSLYTIFYYLFNIVSEFTQISIFEIPLKVRQYRLVKKLTKPEKEE